MLDWVKSWSRGTWAMAWAMVAASAVILVLLFGSETIAGWVAAVWRGQPQQ
jgi:hypothetical protein